LLIASNPFSAIQLPKPIWAQDWVGHSVASVICGINNPDIVAIPTKYRTVPNLKTESREFW
jgi:hypothetical protein